MLCLLFASWKLYLQSLEQINGKGSTKIYKYELIQYFFLHLLEIKCIVSNFIKLLSFSL